MFAYPSNLDVFFLLFIFISQAQDARLETCVDCNYFAYRDTVWNILSEENVKIATVRVSLLRCF